MKTERERLQEMMEDMKRSESTGPDMEYDRLTRRIRPRGSSNGGYTMDIKPEDARMFVKEG